MAIVQDEDAGLVIEALTKKGHRATRINTASGFLQRSNVTILAGVETPQVDEVLEIIRTNCHPRTEPTPPPLAKGPQRPSLPLPAETMEIEVGSAVVFVLDVKRYERL